MAPRSIALVGASARDGAFGNGMIHSCLTAGYAGDVFLVNPRYDEIEGLACYPTIGDIPQTVDLAVLCVANERLEATLGDAIASGAGAAAIFASCYMDEAGAMDETGAGPVLTERLTAMAREATMPICGGNSMGFYNTASRTHVSIGNRDRWPDGDVAMISQSGSVAIAMTAIAGRINWNMLVSSGQELTVTAADYLDYALEMPSTRAVGAFLETVRDPAGFTAALEKAAARDIPVVIVKVGRTEVSAKFAATHSGAIAGSDAAYEAVFDRYGVLRVDDMDELIATLQLVSRPRRAGPGGLASIHDSGGERELLADIADSVDLPLAEISETTEGRLAERLEYGLEPGNPLDAWGTGNDYEGIFRHCFEALVEDPDTAVALWVADIDDRSAVHEVYCNAALDIAGRGNKPVAVASLASNTENRGLTQRMSATAVPVLKGGRPAMVAVRRLLDMRDFRERTTSPPPAAPADATVERWRQRLTDGDPLDEAEGLDLLGDFGIAVTPTLVIEGREAAMEAAAALGYPVALKTAMAEIQHKSDMGGVALGLADEAAVAAAYDDIAGRLGPRCLVAPMASKGVELALGIIIDDQFGPMVMAGAGGALVEHLDDSRCALAPFGEAEAHRLLDGLKLRRLLDGARGAAPVDMDALAATIARLSVLASCLSDVLGELDANPVIAGPNGCIAVDALVVPTSNL
jgi:acetate---CoA ligase (ADP-forming)